MKPNVVENFLPAEGAVFLTNYFRQLKPDVRNNIGFHWGTTDESRLNLSQPIIHSSMHKAIRDIKFSMEQHFGVNLKLKRCLVQTIYKDGFVGEHWDNYYAEEEDGYSQNVYSAILYLSNDYDGGEIKFSKLNIELKPDPGTLIFFPGIEEFEHGVSPVLSGERTNFILFFNNI
jgi:predicted 2-oxoglutarate/Fe(II)-dependent dioxygenase YbiX